MLEGEEMSTGKNYFIASPDCPLRPLQTKDISDGRQGKPITGGLNRMLGRFRVNYYHTVSV